MVKLQRHLIRRKEKILILFEGRDAAGKDGTIKRIVQHLSPRETRVVALGKPSDRDASTWYFQRYVPYLPAAQEMVLFNRSWYNRAGVERVMHFCTQAQYQEFIGSVIGFEYMLIRSGIQMVKYYLDISKAEQRQRLAQRKKDPLSQWKISPIDSVALKNWKAYSRARDAMLLATHDVLSPWQVVQADDKQATRLNVIRDLLHRLPYQGKDLNLVRPDPRVVTEFEPGLVENGMLAH